jgi:hypothetical protein
MAFSCTIISVYYIVGKVKIGTVAVVGRANYWELLCVAIVSCTMTTLLLHTEIKIPTKRAMKLFEIASLFFQEYSFT